LDKDWERKVNSFLAWFLPFFILCSIGNIIVGLRWPHMGTVNALLSGLVIGAGAAYLTLTVMKPVTIKIEKWLEGTPRENGQGNPSLPP
jgi:hypothetical protein